MTVVMLTACLLVGTVGDAAPPLDDEAMASAEARLTEVLGAGWSEGMVVDLALHGLRDPDRDAAARARIDEALTLTAQLAAYMQDQAAHGERIQINQPRWSLQRGIACAADAILTNPDGPRADEAIRLLAPIAERDSSGRAQRLLALLAFRRGTPHGPLDPNVQRAWCSPLERAAAGAVRAAMDDHTARLLLEMATTDWEVLLVGEARMASEPPARALAWVGPIYEALVRVGRSHQEAADLTVAAAGRVSVAPSVDADLHTTARLGAADAALRAARPDEAMSWLEVIGADDPWFDRALAAKARAAEAAGDLRAAMRFWRHRAEAFGQAPSWDEAGRLAHLMGGDGERVVETLSLASAHRVRRGVWKRVLASMDVADGHLDAAMQRLASVPPGDHDQLPALRQLASIATGMTTPTDAAFAAVTSGRAAAMAAASQQQDALRSSLAEPVAASLAAALAWWHLTGPEAAGTEDPLADPALTWLSPEHRGLLELQMLVVRGEAAAVRDRCARDEPLLRRLLARAAPPARAPLSDPALSAALQAIRTMTQWPGPEGDSETQLATAHALRWMGHCETALQWYASVLDHEPEWQSAALGRAECLRQSEDRAHLEAAARTYRALAAVPRDEDPTLWRHANRCLLEVLTSAGVPPERIEAQRARLRAIDPEL